MTPVRIQRRRTRGFRLPPNTVCVTRPGKWGNPFTVSKDDGEWIVVSSLPQDMAYEQYPITVWKCDSKQEAIAKAVELFEEAFLIGDLAIDRHTVQTELRGKNLACFCPIGSPCHADVLLRIANGGDQ